MSHPDNGIENFGLTQQGKQQSVKVILISSVSIKQFLIDCVHFLLILPVCQFLARTVFTGRGCGSGNAEIL